MPQIPRYDEAQVSTTGINIPRAASNYSVDQALGGLGQTMEHVGSQIQTRMDQSAVMESQVSLNKQIMEMQTAALKRQGHDALDNKALYDQFDKVYTEHANQMKTPQQQWMFKKQTADYRNDFELALERHAANESHKLAVDNSAALVETNLQKLSTLYRDPEQFGKQLKVTMASQLDSLHMQGISEQDPIAAVKMQELKSTAYVDRIKQMMADNPMEAKHLFEVHQDDIEPTQREQLKHAVSIASSVQEVDGIIERVRTKIEAENPTKEVDPDELYEEAKKYTQDRTTRTELRKELAYTATLHNKRVRADFDRASGAIYMRAHEDWDHNRQTPVNAVKKSPDFLSLPENEQVKVLEKVEAENWKIHEHDARMESEKRTRESAERTAKRQAAADERRAAAEERRAKAEEKKALKEQWDQRYNYLNNHPEEVAQMTPEQWQAEAGNMSHADYKNLSEQRKKLTTPQALSHATIEAETLNHLIKKAGITAPADVKKYGDMARHYLVAAQKEAKHQLSPKEKEEAIIQGLQHVAVRHKESRSLFGKTISEDYTIDDQRRMEVKNPAAIVIPPQIEKRFDQIETARGIKLTPERRRKLYDEMLKEG